MSETPRIFLLDDEADVSRAVGWLLESIHLRAEAFEAFGAFQDALLACGGPCCVILDLRMPGTGGLDVIDWIRQKRPDVPVTFLSGHGDVPTVVRAMKCGAFDFLQKPFDPQSFIDCINKMMRLAYDHHAERHDQQKRAQLLAKLSSREQEVLALMQVGVTGKEIARRLEISPKTVEAHCANVLRKLALPSRRDLIGLFQRAPAA